MIDNPFDPKYYPSYVPFDKRHVVFDFPIPTPNDSCVKFYSAWRPFIRGALASLMYRDMWDGSESDVDVMVQQAGNLLDAFSETTCELVTQYRIDPDDPCIIQSSDDGITWLPFFDARCGQVDPDLTVYIKKIPYANENLIQPVDGSIGLLIDNHFNHALKASSIGAIPAILESLANDAGNHDYNLLLTSPTPRADRKAIIGIDVFGTDQFDVLNFEGAFILPQHDNVADGQDNTNRRGSLYRHLELSDLDGLYAAVQVTDEVVDFKRLAYTSELPTEGLDGAGITAVELNQIVPTATPYATLSTPSTIQDQLLSLGINRGIGIASISAVGLDAGTDPDIESTANTDGDLEITLGIPAGATGATGATGDKGDPAYPVIELPLDGEHFDYDLLIQSYGTFFPIMVPNHFSVKVIAATGIWATADTVFGLVPYPPTGSTEDFFDDIGLGTLMVYPTWPDHRTELGVSAWDGLESTDDATAMQFIMHTGLGSTVRGQILATIRFTNTNIPTTEWTHSWDFSTAANELPFQVDSGEFMADVGIVQLPLSDQDSQAVAISIDLTAGSPFSLTTISGFIYVEGIENPNIGMTLDVSSDSGTMENRSYSQPTATGTTTTILINPATGSGYLYITITAADGGASESPFIQLTSLTISGTGTDPFV